ncbi:MAM and LDL-receptor class A domain-containing protein 1-like [Lineus longissimus]|uniref:MAM and LDL-receptor class A domain-containing protein 1-like n=1 Tax=Lineus longissimus TaxID=88925 RepID=UPI00315C88C3
MESLVNFQSGIQRCLDFAYHMYGRTMGTLEVKLRVDGVLQSSNLFQKIGDLGNQWLVEKLVIPKQKGTSYKIVFVGIKGSSYTSDIAVDDIVVEPCGINPVKSTPKPVITKAPRPATTKAPRPATTPAPRPATTKAPRPASTRTPLPASTLTPRPATTKAPRPASTRTPLPASTLAPRPATTKAPRPASTRTPLPASTLAPRPATTKVPRPATTKAPRPMTTNAPPVPYNDKPIMVYTRPLMCNFEEDLEDCFLSNSRDDRTDFVRTDSCFGTTSPCLDHTTGKGYYLVFRAEFSVPDDQGSLNSPWMVFEKKQVCFGGFFQGAGASSAKILVQKLDYKHVDIEYPMTISWQWEEWNTTITISGPFRIVLIASSHGDDTASVSVDDMYISPGKCNKTPRPVPTTARPVTSRPSTVFPKPTTKPNALFMTDFDGNGGDFHDEVGFFSWSANIGETPSRGTGPASDHTTGAGRYMYVEVSTPRRTGDVFKMVSDDVQTSTDFVCLTFWLSAQGRHLGEFRAQIVDAHSYNIYDEVINAPYSPGNTDWTMKSLQAHVMKGEVRIVFIATRERWSGDYAVDDVTLKADTCPSV